MHRIFFNFMHLFPMSIRVHVMAGKKPSSWTDNAMDDVYIENIQYAAQRLSEVIIIHYKDKR